MHPIVYILFGAMLTVLTILLFPAVLFVAIVSLFFVVLPKMFVPRSKARKQED